MRLVRLALGAAIVLATGFDASSQPIPPRKKIGTEQLDRAQQQEQQKALLPKRLRPLADGLQAITERDFDRAWETHLTMTPGSAERLALEWSIASAEAPAVSASRLAELERNLGAWPMQARIRTNYERAFLSRRPEAAEIISEFEQKTPESNLAIVALIRAYEDTGNTEVATDLARSWWPTARLSARQQARYSEIFEDLLRTSDHKRRMDRLLYDGKTGQALRLASLAKAESLAKGRAAVINSRSDASRELSRVDESWSEDPGYLFSAILLKRRKGEYETAANLLQPTPHDPDMLVDPDRWWVERRIVSREMLERGKRSQAYVLAAAHSATGTAAIADAEFHAGWFALRFIEKPETAEEHFEKLEEVVTTPISKSRALYWLGRAAEADQRPDDARKRYEEAAGYPGTFYGQLAHERLGRSRLELRKVTITYEDRKAFSSNPLVMAITAFETLEDDRRAGILYRHLAKTLSDPAHLRLLALRLELQGKHDDVLTVGKSAFNRGIQIEKLAFPTGAIPREQVTSTSNLPMMYAIARQESAFRIDAVSPVGALGLLQVMPRTARAVAKRLDLTYSKNALVRDPALNATIGAAYFQEQLDRWNGSYVLTLAAYNAGPKRVENWLKRFGDPRGKSTDEIIDWIESIPFPETRNYVMRVMEGYQVYKARLSQSPLNLAKDLAAGS
ncbi:lytic transglycosylase domain-containing protein [Roseibium sp.]|uniref:lytic transglycosylase domain-containing protein n=1 Tax=Roseibium sp. TaxID=1936156 RepID=UPI0026118E1F|nr:lytic transglycosylase domain-containing protein [Roseibium sp.]